MLTIKDKGLVLSIIRFCERIIEKTNSILYDDFCLNKDIKEIVCFNMFQIGELSKKISDDFKNKYNEIPWKQVMGMRDRIVHAYDSINIDIVWNTSKTDIVSLLKYCKMIVSE